MQLRRSFFLLLLILLLGGCSAPAMRGDVVRPAPSRAETPATSGPLAELAARFDSRNRANRSGFRLMDRSDDALKWRLALIDSAVSSIDVQTYLWYPDDVGTLFLERVVRAADRGVKVRLIVDDLLTMGLGQLMYELQNHPNIEMRIFNPWKERGPLARAGEIMVEMERLNHRMHDKLLVADGVAAVVGGRNIGDHYFGLSDDYNFHDLDVLGFGAIGRQASGMFDSFWNSEWVVSAANLDTEPDPAFVKKKWQQILARNRASEKLRPFGVEPRDWKEELKRLSGELHEGSSRLVYDTAEGGNIAQNVAAGIFGIMATAQKELLITNAYIIPNQAAIEFLHGLVERGVRVKILTNSLATHDVPAVNSHYKEWRDDLVRAGVELHELRPDAAIRPLVVQPHVKSRYLGLHAKAFVVDRKRVFIGSMNLDPRSFNINAEAGVVIDSPGLGEVLAKVMIRDMSPQNAWQVKLDAEGRVYWEDDRGILTEQPARNIGQRIQDLIFEAFPREQY